MKISFLYLNAFSAVGGIQKFNKNFLRALSELSTGSDMEVFSYSLRDNKKDLTSYPNIQKDSAEGSKAKFILNAVAACKNSDTIILGHVNLAFPLALIFRVVSPRSKIILITHGIEVWSELSAWKKRALKACHTILSVSNFTKQKLIEIQGAEADRIKLLPNTLDPDFKTYQGQGKPADLLKKYQLTGQENIILTLCRLSSTEKYKGYDKVIDVLSQIKQAVPNAHYILAGKADAEEVERLKKQIKAASLEGHVTITGYILDEEVPKLYALCDVFILPSLKEGFGIVFLEALASGKPVIGGNRDGSSEALLGGKLGILINPENPAEIREALINTLLKKEDPELRKNIEEKTLLKQNFGFEVFKERLKDIIRSK